MKIFTKIKHVIEHCPDQNQGHLNSRQALKELLLENFSQHLSSGEPDLSIHRHLCLKSQPEIKVSITHSKGIGAACVSSHYRSIGMDLERVDRKFNSRVKKFYLHSDDYSLNHSLLETWVIKEAAFKALSPLLSDNSLVLKKIILLSPNTFKAQGHEQVGSFQLEKITFEGTEYYLAHAWI